MAPQRDGVAAPTKPIVSTVSPLPTVESDPRLKAIWDQLDKGTPSTSQMPPPAWLPAYSIPFPNEWPPTPDTVWVRYAYGQQFDINLRDAVRVSPPWARIELHRGSAAVDIVPVGTRLTPVATQGVRPLDAASKAILAREDAARTYCLQLTALPQGGDAQVADVKAYYRTWVGNNGAFVDLIKSRHTGFLSWVNE